MVVVGVWGDRARHPAKGVGWWRWFCGVPGTGERGENNEFESIANLSLIHI